MYLEIKLKPNIKTETFINKVVKTVLEEQKKNQPSIKTWQCKKCKNEDDSFFWGFYHLPEQYCDKGVLEFITTEDTVIVDYRFNKEKADFEVLSILFCRFAYMLRNHFGNHIKVMSLKQM